MKDNKKQAIADWLNLGLPLTALECVKRFKTIKCTNRISELEREGKVPKVHRKWVTNPKTGARYMVFSINKV